MMRYLSCCCLVILLVFSSAAQATVGPQGFDPVFVQQVQTLAQKAENGDVKAQVALADLYKKKKPEPDYKNAAIWFAKAAEAGDPYAQVELGVFYWNGWGVSKDDKKALTLFQKAMAQDFDRGYGAVGAAYLWGRGIDQNYDEAAKWLRIAAEKGNVLASIRLASLYKRGLGVPEDGKEAEKWLLRATNAKSDPFLGDAFFETAFLYERGAKGIEPNEEAAISWYEMAMDHGSDMAYVRLSNLLSDEKGTEDHTTAFQLLKTKADEGYVYAMNDLGILYRMGTGTPKDEEKAIYWFRKGAEAGEPTAQFHYASGLERGNIVKKDLKKAYEYYSKSAEQGFDGSIEHRDRMRKEYGFSLKTVYFSPNPVSPGQEGRITIEYLPPATGKEVEIISMLSLWFGELQLVPPFERVFTLSQTQTTQSITLPLPIPADAAKGIYKITVKAESAIEAREGQSLFEVK